MLIPNRFSNLKFSLLNITSLVIDHLIQEPKSKIDDIVVHLNNYSQEFDRDDVRLAITFLYALGKVSYSEKSDTVTLLSAIQKLEAIGA